MALHIRDAKVDTMVRELASREGIGLTDAVALAVSNELAKPSIRDRIRAQQQRLAAIPNSGLLADKAFYDSLNDE